MRRGPEESSRTGRRELLGRRQRRLAWICFLLLAAYSPVVAWLDPGDTWMAPVAVAAIVGYAIVVDDVLRHRPESRPTVESADVTTRGCHDHSPGSTLADASVDASMNPNAEDSACGPLEGPRA